MLRTNTWSFVFYGFNIPTGRPLKMKHPILHSIPPSKGAGEAWLEIGEKLQRGKNQHFNQRMRC